MTVGEGEKIHSLTLNPHPRPLALVIRPKLNEGDITTWELTEYIVT